MADVRRSSRADRRKRIEPPLADERRKTPPADVTVSAQPRGGEFFLFVSDPITASNCAFAREFILRQFKQTSSEVLVIDLQKCSYVDTPGLSLLFDFKRGLEAEGRALVLQNPSRMVLRMLNITRMARVFTLRMTNADHEMIPAAKSATEGSSALAEGTFTPDFTTDRTRGESPERAESTNRKEKQTK